jgi:hypothetical protein
LRFEHLAVEHVSWETFRGHLLDSALARESAKFEAWNVFLDGERASSVPLLSIKWQADLGRIHVTRHILTHGFETFEETPGVILSRPVHKWITELVGTIEPNQFPDAIAAELGVYLFLAVIGTSRLPITSLESPLPDFSLGQIAYVPGLADADEPWTDAIAFLQATLGGKHTSIEQAKTLETALRATPAQRLTGLVNALQQGAAQGSSASDFVPGLFRTVFNHMALSPYTEFADRMIAVLLSLATVQRLGAEVVIDLLGGMLRHLCRHLTAFDLTLFHNFGANYPDALFLDSLLKAYLQLIDERPDLFSSTSVDNFAEARSKPRRRRALRHACMVRKQYEGHRVPDAPTSMGENVRVMPAPFTRVPEEQILQVSKRRRTLFDGQPLESLLSETGRSVLAESIAELEQSIELDELGMAQFLSRPLGACKESGEVDRTPLLSHEAFSRSVAQRRLSQLESYRWITEPQRSRYRIALETSSPGGVAVSSFFTANRPGVVSLGDAQTGAADFVFMKTIRRSLDDLLSAYDLQPLERVCEKTARWLSSDDPVLLVEDASPGESPLRRTLKLYDERAELRLELGFFAGPDRMVHYRERHGIELVDRLQLLRIAELTDGGECVMRDVRDRSLWLEVR